METHRYEYYCRNSISPIRTIAATAYSILLFHLYTPYGGVMFVSMKATSLRPGAIWLYRFQIILGFQSVWAAADENVLVSKYKAHALEFEAIWQA